MANTSRTLGYKFTYEIMPEIKKSDHSLECKLTTDVCGANLGTAALLQAKSWVHGFQN